MKRDTKNYGYNEYGEIDKIKLIIKSVKIKSYEGKYKTIKFKEAIIFEIEGINNTGYYKITCEQFENINFFIGFEYHTNDIKEIKEKSKRVLENYFDIYNMFNNNIEEGK
jgi:hypothetical protein